LGLEVLEELFARSEFSFQSLQIVDDYTASIDLYQAFGLEAGKIAGDQFAHGSNLRRQFLVADRQDYLHSVRHALALGSGKAQEERSQAVPHGGEGEFLDDSHQPSQPATDHAQHLKRNFRMSQAERLKVLLTDKQKCGVVDGGHRGRVVSPIEDRELGDGAAWPIDTENLFTSAGGTLENADVAGRDDIQARARLALAENGLACGKTAGHCALGQESKFRLREPREDLDSRQCLNVVKLDFRHGGYCTEALSPSSSRRKQSSMLRKN